MGTEVLIAPFLLCRQHHRIDRIDHWLAVAPRMVAAQLCTAQTGPHKLLGGAEHLRIGAPESVDALLGIAHDEHAGCRGRTGIARQPGMQRLPLHRVGVLEFVHQQMAQLRIQPLLNPAAQQLILQQQPGGLFDVVHVDPAMAALDLGIAAQQHARQPRHALLVEPGFVLGLRQAQALQLRCRILRCVELGQMLRQAVGVLHEEGGTQLLQALLQIRLQEGLHHLLCGSARGLVLFLAEQAGARMPALAGRLAIECGCGGGKFAQLGHQTAKVRHGCLHHALPIRQHELHPFGQRRHQRLERIAAAVAHHQRLVVGHGGRILQQGLVERAPHFGHGTLVIFQQFVLARQAELLQQLQRRGAQQGGKPAVEGADLHAAAVLQQTQIQRLQGGGFGLGLLRRHAALRELRHQLVERHVGKLGQPLVQALPHFGGGLLGEGDRQNLLRLCSRQQGSQHAADQHPGLARTGAGFHHHMAGRIAGNGIESLRRHGAAIGGVGVVQGARHAFFSSSQKSRRHRPRMAQ